ncbi:carbon monoxide dehydrogenase subunit G [Telmatospirillum sp. J64-1]|uniref:SRPBCC family protein n=1 Tax=Telmatospirillum sp. J64-1 TaxID=2502183 RepID=UPI00115ED27C|nr:carbon monoxide dehydrogenase subunit G [Telmatospirillum sp. J64-1]
MDMAGEQFIPASPSAVWEALNDPDILRRCIPGCESVERLSEMEFTAKVTAKVGPVRARFSGRVQMEDVVPGVSCRLVGEGMGGAAGFAKGGAAVTLAEQQGGTLLRYEAQGAVGGKLAQVGARLVDTAAKKMANDFFTAFRMVFEEEKEQAAPSESAAATAGPEAGAAPAPAPSQAGQAGAAPAWGKSGLIAVAVLALGALVFVLAG